MSAPPDRRSQSFTVVSAEDKFVVAQPAVAIAIPVKNEAACLAAMLAALDCAAARYSGQTSVVLMLNGCTDESAAIAARVFPRHLALDVRLISLLPEHAHAGWARRLALDAATEHLKQPIDLLMSTDADTLVDPDWIARNATYHARGYDAVAGKALTPATERAALSNTARRRLNLIGRYYTALDYLRSSGADANDPWPRHYYEGGASISLTLAAYRLIGGAPTPPLAEDKALFDRLRDHGARIRHPLDVRVFTSCRTRGRAPGGMADALARWIAQGETEPVHETYTVNAALEGSAGAADRLTFRTLPLALQQAQRLIAHHRMRSAAPPKVEPKLVMNDSLNDLDDVVQQGAQFSDGGVPALGVVSLTGPMDEQHVTA